MALPDIPFSLGQGMSRSLSLRLGILFGGLRDGMDGSREGVERRQRGGGGSSMGRVLRLRDYGWLVDWALWREEVRAMGGLGRVMIRCIPKFH